MCSYPKESHLEKYVKDFVYHSTAERVELYLKDDIVIKHKNKCGSIVLGIFWSNVLQCDRNFPQYPFIYKKEYDDVLKEEKLMLTVDEVHFTVYLKSGMFTIRGQYIYDWFCKQFQNILTNFDVQFGDNWKYEATKVENFVNEEEENCNGEDLLSETEKYMLMRNTVQPVYLDFERKLQEGKEDIIKDRGNLNIDHEVFTEEELNSELQNIPHGGVTDANVVYKIWKSLLNKWFAKENTQVYLCTPELDAERLKDVIDLYLQYKTLGDINSFFVNQICDATNKHSILNVKKTATKNLDDKTMTFVQYRILRKMIHPGKPTYAKFIAGVRNGEAEVLITSASFNAHHFVKNSSEMLFYCKMTEEAFLEKYVQVLSAPNATIAY